MRSFVVIGLLAGMVAVPRAGVAATGPDGAAFYTPPSALPPGPPGTVVWSRPLSGPAAIKSAASNTLVLYRETTINGTDTVVSGAVAIPKGTPPAGGWPVISWAHGTTGNAPDCAPTRLSEPEYEQTYLDAWVARGFVVLQTDYEGQGTPGLHPYFVGESAARDVTDIVRAARALDPHIGSRWFAFGHSEGGSASLFTAMVAPLWAPELPLLGAVSFAPGSHISGLLQSMPRMHESTPALVFMLEMIEGIASVDHTIDLHAILAPAGLERLPELQQKCTLDLMREETWTTIAPADVLKAGANLTPLVRDFAANDSNRVVTKVPILLLQGTGDDVVSPVVTDSVSEELCLAGDHVTYRSFEDLTHESIVTTTLPAVADWTDDVLAGSVPPATCD